ncbi:MAG: RdgB/HAM1 family non-canonical purine NTP pyrophosphatase [Azospirillaceae bacterium]
MTTSTTSRAPGRRFSGETLIIASHNVGKVREIGALLSDHVPRVVSAGELGLPEPEETGESFIDNAVLKALASAEDGGAPALSDDSGLAVDALAGAPGIHSARWAVQTDGTRDFGAAMERVMARLAETADGGTIDRRARFVCALALAWPDGHVETVEGRVEGTLVWPPRGDHGFGYDPIFVPDGFEETFGEMDPAVKHAISHRADAFAKLRARCFGP